MFADRLIAAIKERGNPCVVGLDPRINLMPVFIEQEYKQFGYEEGALGAIREFNEIVLEAIWRYVPAVKLQIAFYEQYGLGGMRAFVETIASAKDKGLLVIVDAKRNDIASTAAAYASAFLGRNEMFGESHPVFDVDCITVSPFLGEDSLEPFVSVCRSFGKGVFVLVKTSNKGSSDLQDLRLEAGGTLYERLAQLVDRIGLSVVGHCGYSSIGAVVGATFPQEAQVLRALMPRAIFLVPGYGAQGGKASDVSNCFNGDGLGAVVNASRSVTYAYSDRGISPAELRQGIERRLSLMITDVRKVVADRVERK